MSTVTELGHHCKRDKTVSFGPVPPPNYERIKPRTDTPKNAPIFTRRRLQLEYNYTTPYLEI